MKAKDVPQDDANMMEGKFREPVYSLDEDGRYTTVRSVGWEAKNAVMQHAWDEVNEKIEAVRAKVLARKLSPIAYYTEKNIMDAGLVAKYMGICRFRVKRHMKTKPFDRLSERMLKKYAAVFNISLEELTNIELLRTNSGIPDHENKA